jgi:apolipoprotein D and lipocalin family protein
MHPRTRRIAVAAGVGTLAALLVACQSAPRRDLPPVAMAPRVDVPRFAGTWYVIAVIPTFLEKDVVGASETYTLQPDGSIDTLFRYRKESFAAEEKTLRSTAFVEGDNGARWGVQFVWPIRADYRISWLADDYAQTIVGREKRDHVWIMARTPTIPEADLQERIAFVRAQGYDVSKLVRVPQR